MTTRALSLAGKRFSNHGRSAGTLLLFALVSLCAISCTTIPREVAERGLFDTFEMTPQVLLRTDGLFLRDLVDSLDDDTIRRFINAMNSDAPQVGAKKPIDRSRIDSMLSRTHVAAIGIAWNDKTSILFEAALAGNFARIPTAISFALDSSWKRITGGFVAKSAPLYVRDPEGGKLHISSFPFQKSSSGAGARALAEQSGLSASNASFDLYIDAKSALISNLPILDGVTLPFDGLRFIAVRDEVNALVGNADAVYQARFNIRMKDEQSARAFRPIMRLIWVVLSAQISSMGLPIPPEASIELKGSIFETQPFPVHAHEIVDILRTMAEKSGALPSTVAIR